MAEGRKKRKEEERKGKKILEIARGKLMALKKSQQVRKNKEN